MKMVKFLPLDGQISTFRYNQKAMRTGLAQYIASAELLSRLLNVSILQNSLLSMFNLSMFLLLEIQLDRILQIYLINLD